MKEMNMDYRTKDLSLASLLCAAECKLNDYEIDDRDQFWFHYEDSETVRGLARSFYLSVAMVNVQKFTAAQKMLKSLIHKQRKVNDEYTRYADSRRAKELNASQ
jgi:hypothetical protein